MILEGGRTAGLQHESGRCFKAVTCH